MTKARDLANIISGGFTASDIPNLDTSKITTGELANARVADLPTSKITSGTFADARFPATLPVASGVNLTALNATNIGSGTVPTARLGTGTASSSTVLYGDQTYKAEPGGGKVLQIVQMAKTDTTSINGTSYGDITGLSLAITPTAASSKILLTGNINYGFQNDGWLKFQVDIDGAGYNDVTGYMGAAAGSRQVAAFGAFQASSTAGWSPMYLHAPSYTLTDVLTYKIQGIVSNGTYPFYINRNWTDSDSTGYGRTATTLVFMEIAA